MPKINLQSAFALETMLEDVNASFYVNINNPDKDIMTRIDKIIKHFVTSGN